jgi:hypothetical protein
MLTLLEREQHMRAYEWLPMPAFLLPPVVILVHYSLVGRKGGRRAALGSKCLVLVGFLATWGFFLFCSAILGAVLDLGRKNREELAIVFLLLAALLHM